MSRENTPESICINARYGVSGHEREYIIQRFLGEYVNLEPLPEFNERHFQELIDDRDERGRRKHSVDNRGTRVEIYGDRDDPRIERAFREYYGEVLPEISLGFRFSGPDGKVISPCP
jgi:hypothetical protein